MTAIFPGDIKSFTPVIDNFDVVEAANINPVYEEITSIETWLERTMPIGYHARTGAMTTDITLSDTDYPIQYLDPTTDEFTVSLPSATDTNHIYFIRNTNAAVALSVLSGTDEVVSVEAETTTMLVSDGATWSAISGGGDSVTYSSTIMDISDTDSAGTTDAVSRGDHKHKIPMVDPIFWDSTGVGLKYGTGLSISSGSLVATGGGGGAAPDEGNLLINGGFDFWERSLTPDTPVAMADVTYNMPDRWYSLIQGANPTIGRAAGGYSTKYCCKLTAGGTTNRMGIAQLTKQENVIAVRGKDCIGQLMVKPVKNAGSGTMKMRMAILEWTGTADAPALECVNNWASGTFTAGNFFTSTTLTVVSVGSVEATHNTWTQLSTSGSISTSANNLYTVIWTEDAPAHASDYVLLSDAGLYRGTEVRDWMPRPLALEKALCQYYGERIATPEVGMYVCPMGAKMASNFVGGILILRPKRVAPSMTHNITAWSTNTTPATTEVGAYNYKAAAMITISGALTANWGAGTNQGRLGFFAGTSFSTDNGDFIDLRWGSNCVLWFSSELGV